VWLEPNTPPAFPEAVRAILSADLIVIGPGSLYTSILPNLLVPDISAAIRSSRALKMFICNVATQLGETEDYSCGDHLRAVEEHVGSGLFDLVVCNWIFEGNLPEGLQWVVVEDDLDADYPIYRADLIDYVQPWRHEAKKLSQVVIDLLEERTGPLVES